MRVNCDVMRVNCDVMRVQCGVMGVQCDIGMSGEHDVIGYHQGSQCYDITMHMRVMFKLDVNRWYTHSVMS